MQKTYLGHDLVNVSIYHINGLKADPIGRYPVILESVYTNARHGSHRQVHTGIDDSSVGFFIVQTICIIQEANCSEISCDKVET
jgi:hypothetical protein